MAAEDFDAIPPDQDPFVKAFDEMWVANMPTAYHTMMESALLGWLNARKYLLRDKDRPLQEVIAARVLRGKHDELAVLYDWMAEQGRLGSAGERIKKLREALLNVRERLKEIERGLRGGQYYTGPAMRGEIKTILLWVSEFLGLGGEECNG